MFQDYYLAQSVSDVINRQKKFPGQTAIIAGGTDLLLDISEGKKKVERLIDITRIPKLKKITMERGFMKIGAAVTHAEVAQSDLVKRNAPALAMAAAKVGSLQIRNVATVVGNVINAQPAADAAVALAALGAKVEIVGNQGIIEIEIEKMYAGVGKSTVNSSFQLVTAILVPPQENNQSSAFVRLDQRKVLALPMLNVAVMVSLDLKNMIFQWVRIAMAPVGPGPVRATEAEAILKGAAIDGTVIEKAAQAALTQANPRSSEIRGSREYRLQVLPVLVKRALHTAIDQVTNGPQNF